MVISFCLSFFLPKLKKVFFFGFLEAELMSEATETESSDCPPPLASFEFHISSRKFWLPNKTGSRAMRLTREGVELALANVIRGGFSITVLTSTGSSGFVTSMVGVCVTSLVVELSFCFWRILLTSLVDGSAGLFWILVRSLELLIEDPEMLEDDEDGMDGGGDVGGGWNSDPITLKSEKKLNCL